MSERWENWSGGCGCEPALRLAPDSEDAIAAAVREAATRGQVVRPLGAGHSSSDLVPTEGVLLSLEHWRGVIAVDPDARTARIRSGTRLYELGEPLRAAGLAMANLGDIDRQALAGALATGTHGTGRTLGNLSSRVRSLRLVDGRGALHEIGPGDADALRAARVSLGALGVITEATLELLPAYRLHERTWRAPVEPVLDELADRIARHRHFEFFYFPKHDFAECKAIDPTDAAIGTPAEHERVDWSDRILPSPRDLKFHEMEYALPAAAGPDCFREVVARIHAQHPEVAWPIEYRTVHADDAWLSPAHDRETVTLSIHQDGRHPFRPFFADVESILAEHGGRPHWGKVHTRRAADLAPRYPAWDRFLALRAKLDPDRRFVNAGLAAVLGLEAR